MSKWQSFGSWVKLLAPIILTSVNPKLAPIAVDITNAVTAAEAIPGATGPAKLAHVKDIANNAAKMINDAKGHEVVPIQGLNEAVDKGVSATVSIINLLQSHNITPVQSPVK